jgi:hypothetical protein
MSVNEYSADEFTASTTHAAIFILSVHGVFEPSALISMIVQIDVFRESQPGFIRHPVISYYWDSNGYRQHFSAGSAAPMKNRTDDETTAFCADRREAGMSA